MNQPVNTHPAVLAAIERFEGGQSALARHLHVFPQAIDSWKRCKKKVPAKHCAPIEAATGIRCEELRPDLTWTRNMAGEITGYHVKVQT